jgi:hypothetical protein
MAQTLQECLAEFVGKPPGFIGFYILEPASCKADLEKKMNIILRGFQHVDGAKRVAEGHPVKSATQGEKVRTAEEIGHLLSYVELMKRVLKTNMTHLCVFESHCATTKNYSLEGLCAYIRGVKEMATRFAFAGTDDFLLFGVEGLHVERPITPALKATTNFKKPVSFLISRAMMEKVVGSYEYLLRNNVVVAMDELLGLVLRAQQRWAVCPEGDFFQIENRPLE